MTGMPMELFHVPDEVLADRWNAQPIYTDSMQEETIPIEVRLLDAKQPVQVVGWLIEKDSMTCLEAINAFGITRLPSIIFRLKKRGYVIEREMVNGTNRFGKPSRYARYWLRGVPDAV